MKWLITGGLGFVGTNLAIALLKEGHEVVLFDNFSRLGTEHNLAFLKEQNETISIVRGDIRNWIDMERLASVHGPFDAVAHTAGQVSMIESVDNPRYDFEVNALGTFNVCEMVRHYCPKAVLLYTSTNKVYGDLSDVSVVEDETRWRYEHLENGMDESHSIFLHGPYSCSKGIGDQYVHDYHGIYGLRTVVFRMSTIYGPRQFATFSQGWISWFIAKALEGKPFTINGDGKQVRDILHASDLARAFMACANTENAWGQTFNVGGSPTHSLSLIELFSLLETKLNVKLEWEKLPARPADQKVYLSDVRKLQTTTGWSAQIEVEQGIDEQIDWIRKCLQML